LIKLTASLTLLLAGCSEAPADGPRDRPDDPTSSERTDTGTTPEPTDTEPDPTGTTEPSDLRGEEIFPPLEPPVFSVQNLDEAARNEVDLTGHPSVVWFFRDSAEAG